MLLLPERKSEEHEKTMVNNFTDPGDLVFDHISTLHSDGRAFSSVLYDLTFIQVYKDQDWEEHSTVPLVDLF